MTNCFFLQANHRIFDSEACVSDVLPLGILDGSIKMKSDIREITPNGVAFEDGTKEENIDGIILATGYLHGYPMLKEGILTLKENRPDLYKGVWPPHLKHPTFAVIGALQPLNAVGPAFELQARWATRVFKVIMA